MLRENIPDLADIELVAAGAEKAGREMVIVAFDILRQPLGRLLAKRLGKHVEIQCQDISGLGGRNQLPVGGDIFF